MFMLIPFPAKWDTTLQQFLSEPELNAIFTELGRLAVVYNHMDQGVFDALSYLINHSDYVSAVRAAELIRGFTNRRKLLMELYELKVVDTDKRSELRSILDDARQCDDDRNKYLHSRWYVSDRTSGEARSG
jgi:hypothetical protein